MQQMVRRRLAVITAATLLAALMVPTMVGATQVEDTIVIEWSGEYRCIVEGEPVVNHESDNACDEIEDREPGSIPVGGWEPPAEWLGGVCQVEVHLDNNHSVHATQLRVGPLVYEGVELESTFTDTSRQFDIDGHVTVAIQLDPEDLVTSLGGQVKLFCTAQTEDTTPPETTPSTEDTTPPSTEDTTPPSTEDTTPPSTEDTAPPSTEDTVPETVPEEPEDTTPEDEPDETIPGDEPDDTTPSTEATSDTLPFTGVSSGAAAGVALLAALSGGGLLWASRGREN